MKKPEQFTSAQKCAKNIFLSALLLLLALPTYGQFAWMQPTNLSQAKSRMGAASLGTKAYFAGGDCNPTVYSTVEIYDVAVGDWALADNLSVARRYPAGVACDHKVFFAGGFTSNPVVVYDEVDIFNANGTLLQTIHLSVPRFTAAVANDSIVIFAGGLTNLGENPATTDVVDIYNTKSGDWVTTAADKLSVARDAKAAVVVGDLAIFAGGFTDTGVTDRVDIYNFAEKTWATSALSVARGNIAATVVGDKAFFAGGANNNNVSSTRVDIYDASNGNWEIAELSVARAFLGSIHAATICGKAFFVGGGDLDYSTGKWTSAYNVIDIYDPNEDSWQVEHLSSERNNHAVVAVGDTLLVTGDACESIVEIGAYPPGSCIVGVSSLDPESEYTIYPNPAKEELIINASFKNRTRGTLALFDIMGRTLYHYEFDENMLDHQIELSSFSPGIYLVEIKTNRESYVEKVMIVE